MSSAATETYRTILMSVHRTKIPTECEKIVSESQYSHMEQRGYYK